MDSFFISEESTQTKCSKCPLVKHRNFKTELIEVGKSGSGEVLFVLEFPEAKEQIDKFRSFLYKNNFNNYRIIAGLQCQPKNYTITGSTYIPYGHCNLITEEYVIKNNIKVIVTIGRAVNAITQSDDIPSWKEFSEILFNQTYFITPFHWKIKIRVYPIPAFYEFLGLDNFENYFTRFQFSKIQDHLKNFSFYPFDPYELKVVDEPNNFLIENIHLDNFSWDTETNSLNMFMDNFQVGVLTVSPNRNTGFYLDMNKVDKVLLNKFFFGKTTITANGKFDSKSMRRVGVDTDYKDDVIILSHLLNTVRTKNSIKSLAWLIGFGGYDKELSEYLTRFRIQNYLDVPTSILSNYACLDTIVTYRLFELLNTQKRKQPKVFKVYEEVVIPADKVFLEAEMNGMELDLSYIQNLNESLHTKITVLENEIRQYLKKDINLNSSEQLGKALEELGWPNLGVTKKGIYRTGDLQLQEWRNLGYEMASKILEMKSWVKLKNSFVGEDLDSKDFFNEDSDAPQGLLKFLSSDGKVHCTFRTADTGSGRSACSNPNLQQMPKQGKEGRLFRPSFKCPKGYWIAEPDYSGFQLRIVQVLSKDPVMEDIFLNQGGDMHSITAASVFCPGMPTSEFLSKKKYEPYKTYRQLAKSINFAYIFGAMHYILVPVIRNEWSEERIQQFIQDNDIKVDLEKESVEEAIAKIIRKRFFETYPKLGEFIESQKILAQKQGYVDSYHGFRRHLPYMLYQGKDGDEKLYKNLASISVNNPVQAFEAYIVYVSMIMILKRIKELNLQSKIVAMVHDAIVLYIKREESETMYGILKECMEVPASVYGIPFLVDVGMGHIWGFDIECHENNVWKFKEGSIFEITVELGGHPVSYFDIGFSKQDFVDLPNLKNIELVHP